MSDKIFRVDYYPHQAYADFLRMDADEIAIVIQVSNLIYMRQDDIDNDPKFIARSINGMTALRCKKTIQRLIDKGELTLTEEGKISKKMAKKQLETVKKRREFFQDAGKNGAEIKKRNKQNQELDLKPPSNEGHKQVPTPVPIPDNKHLTPTSTAARGDEGGGVLKNGKGEEKNSPPPSTPSKPFDIERHLTDADRAKAREAAPGWDLHYLMRIYNEGVAKRGAPKFPGKAFIAWVPLYTKGKKP